MLQTYSHHFPKNCPDWSNTSWPFDKDKSYADLVEKVLYEENENRETH